MTMSAMRLARCGRDATIRLAMTCRSTLAALLLLLATAGLHAADDPAATIYQQRCAACHEQATGRTPPRQAMRQMAPEALLAALTQGAMREQARGLDETDLRTLTAWLTERPLAQWSSNAARNPRCTGAVPPLALAGTDWRGWS